LVALTEPKRLQNHFEVSITAGDTGKSTIVPTSSNSEIFLQLLCKPILTTLQQHQMEIWQKHYVDEYTASFKKSTGKIYVIATSQTSQNFQSPYKDIERKY